MSSSASPIRAWPFLVARGRREGYRTLLAPRFLIDGDLHETLSDAAPTVAVGRLGRVDLAASGAGSLGLTYTTEDLSQSDQDISAETPMWTDEHGRPLEMLYGVVAHQPLSPSLTVDDLQDARREALRAYRRFLTDERGFAVCESEPYLLPGEPASPAAPRMPQSLRAPTAPRAPGPARAPTARRTPWASLAAAGVAVVVAAVLTWFIVAPGPARPAVTIVNATSTPAAGDVCTGTGEVELQAQVNANQPVQVAYRWVSAATPTTGPSQTIELSAKRSTISDLRPAQSGPYRLVIDKPVHGESGPLQCQAQTGSDLTP